MTSMGLLAELQDYFSGEGKKSLNGKFHVSGVDKVPARDGSGLRRKNSGHRYSMVVQGHELHYIGFCARMNVYYCAHISWL